jgi:hypothetical protein
MFLNKKIASVILIYVESVLQKQQKITACGAEYLIPSSFPYQTSMFKVG